MLKQKNITSTFVWQARAFALPCAAQVARNCSTTVTAGMEANPVLLIVGGSSWCGSVTQYFPVLIVINLYEYKN
jgi:hypothetical protein